jgi:glycosyltransferase involved in cell wall biosynthesis
MALHVDKTGQPIIAFYGFRSGPGGISHVMLNLINALVDLGLHVDLLLNRTQIPELASVREEVRLVRLGETDSLRSIPALVRYLRQVQPTALLVNREPAVRAATIAQRCSRTKTRIVIRVGMPVSIALKRRHPIKRWLRQSAIVYCYGRADAIIANSKGVAEDVAAITGISSEKVKIVNNPTVSPDIFVQAEQLINHPWFVPGGPPVILGVGRLVRQKDFPTLLRAFAKLRAQRNCRLVILGEGKERDRLTNLAAELGILEYADLPGYVSNPFAYMNRAAQLVLSSRWEGSPNTLIQALALGLPVVATDCRSGPREILSDGRYGPLVPVGDVEAMFREMLHMLDNPPDKHFLQEAAEPFRIDNCMNAYMASLGIMNQLN